MNKYKFANWPFRPARWPFFYGWVIIFSGTLGILMSIPGQTMGVSTFTDSLISSVKITRGDLSTAYLLGTIASAFLLTWVGKMYDRFGARPIALLSAGLLSLTLVALSQSDHLIDSLFSHHIPVWGKIGGMFLGFFLIRFSGQGALTLVSRNMMMKWFDQRRGFALGFSSVATSLGFSSAPVFFEFLIQNYGWRMAWIILAALIGIGFSFFALLFFRDNPEDSGLKMDGGVSVKRKKKDSFPVIREFTLKEARRTVSFWVFTLMLSLQALYITGLTFNITSVFEVAGMTRGDAINIFLPSAAVSVIITVIISRLSDYIKLKNLLYVMGSGAIIALIGLNGLNEYTSAVYLLIVGNGILMGLYSVVLSVTWPRYFGRKYLGAISGHAVTYIVLASAIGPKLFSWSLDQSGSYDYAGWICIAVFILLTLASFFVQNPQEKEHLKKAGLNSVR